MSERPTIDTLLARPIDQRIREFKYRFAQASVFGLPVILLQLFGDQLSNGREALRWVSIFSVVLCGWIVFVAAVGMFSDGMIELVARRRITFDLAIATLAIAAYLFSVVTTISIMTRAEPLIARPVFHYIAIGLILWCGMRWWWLGRAPEVDRVKT